MSKAVLSVFMGGICRHWVLRVGGSHVLAAAAAVLVFLTCYTLIPGFLEMARLRLPLLPAWGKEIRTLAPKLPVILGLAFLLREVLVANVSSGWAWVPVLFVIAALAVYASTMSRRMEELFSSTLTTLVPIILRSGGIHGDRIFVLRVASHAAAIAQKLLLPEPYVRSVYYGALLHDIGFVAEGKDESEHVQIGYEIVKGIDTLKDAASFVLHHHERFDGKGYPLGLSGRDIPLGARIIAVADRYVSLTTAPPNGHSVSIQEALKTMRASAGVQFDPDLVELITETAEEEEELGFAVFFDNYCFGSSRNPQRWKAESPGQHICQMVVGIDSSPGDKTVSS
ncbi:MAG TPA: HD domain-containing protein [Firmicutes bacterium]|nr:HD domain-containing protein [Bacillota bacterium]